MTMKLVFCVVSAAALVACAPLSAPPKGSHFGEAVMHNIAVQTVNPNAPNDKRPIAFDAQYQGLAQARYEAGKVKEPPDMSASKISVMNSGGGGDSGSK